jgi:hypothetical protein
MLSETSASVYKTKQCHNKEDNNINNHKRRNLKTCISMLLLLPPQPPLPQPPPTAPTPTTTTTTTTTSTAETAYAYYKDVGVSTCKCAAHVKTLRSQRKYSRSVKSSFLIDVGSIE